MGGYELRTGWIFGWTDGSTFGVLAVPRLSCMAVHSLLFYGMVLIFSMQCLYFLLLGVRYVG